MTYHQSLLCWATKFYASRLESGMDDLRKRFGVRAAVCRRRRGLKQDGLAAASDLSVDMISEIERGGTGVLFPATERLAKEFEVDPGKLFTPLGGSGVYQGGPLAEIAANLEYLLDAELRWIKGIVHAVLRPKANGRN